MTTSKHLISGLNKYFESKIDLLICSASFEARSYSSVLALDPGNVKKVILCKNKNATELHELASTKVKELFLDKVIDVQLKRDDPLSSADSLLIELQRNNSQIQNIVVDITTFTREALLILFALINRVYRQSVVSYIYTPAKKYSPSDNESEKWLSQGIGEVRSVLGYLGSVLPSKDLHLILIPGFEPERAIELIERYEPLKVSLGYSSPKEDDAVKHMENHKRTLNKIKSIYGTADSFEFFAYDALRTEAAIQKQVLLHENTNVVVAPLNTKLSTLGAGLAALKNPIIQICYAQPVIYNYTNYSESDEYCYILKLKVS